MKQITNKNGWAFNWKSELDDNIREVYKLTISDNPSIIQVLLSFTIESDYLNAVDDAFSGEIGYSQLIKIYGQPEGQGKETGTALLNVLV